MLELAVEPLVFSALIALTFVPLEAMLQPLHHEPRRALALDLTYATLGQVAAHLTLSLALGSALSMLAPISLESPLFVEVRPLWLRQTLDVALGLLVFELAGYAYHRLAHSSRWLFRLHVVHHSSESLDWLSTFRQHPLELVALTLVQNAPLVMLGIPLHAHATVLILLKVHTVFVHANLRVPAGGWSLLLATPHFHHRHHQRGGAPVNFASLCPLLDKLFGTYAESRTSELGREDRP
jgi:sterol desaturase/sphingolipid hydroxylase (fatty acid hydroxylase superfamily)